MTKRKQQKTPFDPAIISFNIITMLLATDEPAGWARGVDRELEGLSLEPQRKVLALVIGHQMAVIHAMQQLPGMKEVSRSMAAEFLQVILAQATEGATNGRSRK